MTMCSCNASRDAYRFPAMAKIKEWTFEQQMGKLREEMTEVEDAYRLIKRVSPYAALEDIMVRRTSFGMELLDVIHTCETALRMGFSDEEASALRDAVIAKNKERGYYDEATA